MKPESKRFHITVYKNGAQIHASGADTLEDATKTGQNYKLKGCAVIIRDTDAKPEIEYGLDGAGQPHKIN